MPLFVLILFALALGVAAGLAAWRYPRLSAGSPAPAFAAARKAGEAVASRPSLRRRLAPRLDPHAATGLALSLALLLTLVGGVGLGALAYLERSNGHLNRADRSVARWGYGHNGLLDARARACHAARARSPGRCSSSPLVLAVVETIRAPEAYGSSRSCSSCSAERRSSRWRQDSPADTARCTFDPAAAGLGPSFPSGHSATAAAFYAGAALLLSRRRGHVAPDRAHGPRSRRRSRRRDEPGDARRPLALRRDRRPPPRVGWFAICAIAFGGRLLHFGAPAEAAVAAAEAPPSRPLAKRGVRLEDDARA